MKYKIEVFSKNGVFDAAGENLKRDIIDFGIKSVDEVRVSYIYIIDGDITRKQIRTICEKLLIDPVTQKFKIWQSKKTDYSQSRLCSTLNPQSHTVEVYYKSGVTDSVGEAVKIGIQDLNISTVNTVKIGMKYFISGVTKQKAELISEKLLSNKLIQEYSIL